MPCLLIRICTVSLVLPRHQKLFRTIKDLSGGKVRIIMHSDGAILPVLPDLIDAGIDCLNPVQYTVRGIDPAALKKEFGGDITFLGRGVLIPRISCPMRVPKQ